MSLPLEPDYLRGLLEHGDPTDKQRATVEAVIEHGNYRAAANALGNVESNVAQHVSLLRKKAARKGYAPDQGITHGTADGYSLKGYSHLTKTPDGEPIWLKADGDKVQQEQAFREAVEAAKESIPRAKPEKPPQSTAADLCACYVISDAHIGMLAFSEETGGEDWDTQIAEDTITRWIYAAIQSAPKAHTGLLLQLGDWLHFDGLDALTPQSRNILDTDTRFQLLVRVAVRVLRRILSLMLRKHERVHVIMADANHDPASSAWMREVFSALFEDEPRLTIDTSADTYYGFRWGDVSIFAHHGHKSKLPEISRTFAGKFREMYGNTQYSYAHIGHLHHTASKEDPLMITEQHPTLAAMDAYAAKLGCVNQRGAHCITYHRSYGEVGRSTIRPEMLS